MKTQRIHKRALRARRVKAKLTQHRNALKPKVYPEFVYEQTDDEVRHVDPWFVKTVRNVVKHINFGDHNHFTEKDREFLKLVREFGRDAAVVVSAACLFEGMPLATVEAMTDNFVGQHVFNRLAETRDTMAFLPFNSLAIYPLGDSLRVRFDALRRVKTIHGRAYYGKAGAKAIVRGREYPVLHSNHVIKRAVERRTGGSPTTYCEYSNTFYQFNYYRRFEVCDLPHSVECDALLVMYAPCGPFPNFTTYMPERVLGAAHIPGKRYYYRYGYLPSNLDNNHHLHATTLLLPGMRGTPESRLISSHHFPELGNVNVREWLVQQETTKGMWDSGDFAAARYFHQQGVPQVVELTESPTDEDLARADCKIDFEVKPHTHCSRNINEVEKH